MQTVRNRVLLAKEESVYGTDPTPTVSSNAIEASNIKVSYQGDLLQRDNVRSNISPVSPVLGKRWIEITFDCELKGSGTAGTAGRIGDLLEACSMAETISAGGSSSVTYTPTSSSQKSVTFYIYDNDSAGSSVLHKITGAMGSFTLKATAGQYGVLSFTFRGKYNAPTDQATPSTPTYETTAPPIVESCSMTLGGDADLVVQELNLDLANEIVSRDDISSANAILAWIIANRNPKGNFNPEALLIAGYDFWTDWVGATQRALSLVIGSTAGNIITITAPKLTLDNIADTERDRVLTRDIPFSLGQNAGNDEVVIKFT
jgi:hypothetical protein